MSWNDEYNLCYINARKIHLKFVILWSEVSFNFKMKHINSNTKHFSAWQILDFLERTPIYQI